MSKYKVSQTGDNRWAVLDRTGTRASVHATKERAELAARATELRENFTGTTTWI